MAGAGLRYGWEMGECRAKAAGSFEQPFVCAKS